MEAFSTSNNRVPVIAVFDIGKTNKKLFLFDENYKVVYEQTQQLKETSDEDGFLCEDINALTRWAKDSLSSLQHQSGFEIKAINVSAYGASLVHLDHQHNIIGHLTNYLKPYPEKLLLDFLTKYENDDKLLAQTASPLLGNLNSGLQLYRLKYEKPSLYHQIKYSLHLPQYISFLIHGKLHSEITSIGCHTLLWDFEKNNYHDWVIKEQIDLKFPKIVQASQVETIGGNHSIKAGVGLHDSSSALIPYLKCFDDPFVLISTGTWCISLNPFNRNPLTKKELEMDCLNYLSYEGNPVKASRLFAGYEHDLMTKKIAEHFNLSPEYHKHILFDRTIPSTISNDELTLRTDRRGLESTGFDQRDLSQFNSYEAAYHKLMLDVVQLQKKSTKLVLKKTKVKNILVDGGFSNNSIYMNLLAQQFPSHKIFGSSISQGSALGAALVIHDHWNRKPVQHEAIGLRLYLGL